MPNMPKLALGYLMECGFQVIPLDGYKKPLVKWREYQEKRVTPKLVREWWKKHPKANIGIVCGRLSNLLVVDVDTEEGLQALDPYLGDQGPHVQTPNGFHYYFQWPGEAFGNTTRFIKDCDTRGEGGYVVAGGSVTEKEQEKDDAGNTIKYGGLYKRLLPVKGRPSLPPALAVAIERNHSNYSFKKRAPARAINSEGPTDPPESQRSHGEATDGHGSQPKSQAPGVTDGHGSHRESQAPGVTDGHGSHRESRGIIFYQKGRRDEDMFHLANTLRRGRATEDFIHQTLTHLATTCDPPWTDKEVAIKIKSAMDHQERREAGIQQEVREWVLMSEGEFSTGQCHRELRLNSKQQTHACNVALTRLVEDGMIERAGDRRGWYKTKSPLEDPVDWKEAKVERVNIALPWDLNALVRVSAGSITLVAGSPNSGKTEMLTWLARWNMDAWEVTYLSTETSAGDFKDLANKYPDRTLGQWKVKFYEGVETEQMPDYITGGKKKLWLLDYIEVYDNFYRIGQLLKSLHSKLDGGVVVAACQKKRGAEVGIGGFFNQMKPHIAISMDYDMKDDIGHVVLNKVKIPDPEYRQKYGHPQDKEFFYRTVDNHHYKAEATGWHYPLPKKKKGEE